MVGGTRIGIDLGGTKIEGLALAPDGSELARIRVPTPKDDYPAIIQAIAGLVTRLETDLRLSGAQVHTYTLDLKAGDALFGQVVQRGIDAVVTVRDPAGVPALEVDVPAYWLVPAVVLPVILWELVWKGLAL